MNRTKTLLVVGGGGREHALAWKLAQSPLVGRVLVAPGNAGSGATAGCENRTVAADDIAGLLALARDEDVALTVVGPEQPLAAGLVDAFEAAGLRVFGPRRAAARIEASKAWCKDFLARHGIPTADYEVCHEAETAYAALRRFGLPVVIKADGLAAGKGVVVATSTEMAEQAVASCFAGDMPARVVVEAFLPGEEASYIVVADGLRYQPLAGAQDHKRLGDGDTGPNTGGMGAISPTPVLSADIEARVRREIIEPVLAGMVAEGNPFRGFLYAGLMVDATGAAKVLEFNARLGDPETQALLLRLDSDLYPLLDAAAGGLELPEPRWSAQAAAVVVLAAPGYPGPLSLGDPIDGLTEAAARGCVVFHAGTRGDASGRPLTAGGRVLGVAARGDDLAQALARAYHGVDAVRFDGRQFRTDIGARALAAHGAAS